MGQQDYDNWSLQTSIQEIRSLNAHSINSIEEKLIKSVNPKKILDIGCGDGERLFSFLKEINVDFIGIEKFERLLSDSRYREN